MLKKANLKWLSLVIIAIAVAVIFEAALVVLTNNASTDGFEKVEFSAGDFETVEFSQNDDGSFYTLANNSYFEILDVGGIKAKRIDVALNTDETDTTTKLLFFTGKSGVVEGTFSVPLVKTDEGYKAESDFTRIDEIRIYPTEIVRSDIDFFGITVNPGENPIENISPIRTLLWAMSVMALFSIGLIVIRKSYGILWFKVYFIVAAIGGLSAYVASLMFSSANALGQSIIIFALGGVSACYFVAWLIFEKFKALESKVAAVIILVGILMVFANAPLQSPDETSHFQRAYTISKGDLTFEYDFEFPNSINHLIDIFPAEYINNIKNKEISTVPVDIARYNQTYQTEYDGRLTKTSVQLVLPYLPSAALMVVADIFTDNGLVLLYAARIGGLLMFAAAAYYAIRNAERYKNAIVVTCLLPITVYIASSVNYDTLFFSGIIIFFSVVAKSQKKLSDIVIMLIAFGLAIMVKPTYLPLAFFVFAGSKGFTHKSRNINPLFLFVALVASGLAFWQGSLLYADAFNIGIPPSADLEWVNTSAQIKYILSNPIRYAMVMLVDGYQNGYYLGMHGLFGSLDLQTTLTPLLVPLSVACSVLAISGTEKRNFTQKDSVISGVLFFAQYIITVTAFYCIWSTLGSTSILGVQVRYFIPNVFLLCVFLPAIVSRVLKPYIDYKRAETFVFSISSLTLIIAGVEILLGYFLM